MFKVGLAKRESYTKTKPMEQDLGALRGCNLLRTNKWGLLLTVPYKQLRCFCFDTVVGRNFDVNETAASGIWDQMIFCLQYKEKYHINISCVQI